MVTRYNGTLAFTIWLLIMRAGLGVGCMVDGISKPGAYDPSLPTVGDFQPSPLGPVSALIELAAGALVLVGFRTRAAATVLAGHLTLGVILARFRPDPGWDGSMLLSNIVFLGMNLAFGAGIASVDHRLAQAPRARSENG